MLGGKNSDLEEKFINAIFTEDLECIIDCLLKNVSPNTMIIKKDGSIIGPVLNKAVILHNYDIVELLLGQGADPNIQSIYGGALNSTISRGNGKPVNYKILKLLLENGANPFLRNSFNNSPKDDAKYQKKKNNNSKYLDIIEKFISDNPEKVDKYIADVRKINSNKESLKKNKSKSKREPRKNKRKPRKNKRKLRKNKRKSRKNKRKSRKNKRKPRKNKRKSGKKKKI